MVTVTDNPNNVKHGTNIHDSKVHLWRILRKLIKGEMGDLLQIPTVSVNRWTNHFCQ
jgi:hypothetical protein